MRAVFAAAACAALLLPADSAVAQTRRPERPYRGLFTDNASPNATGQRLNAEVSVFGAYDDNALQDRAPNPYLLGQAQTDGYYSGLTASLDYERRGRTMTVGSAAGAAARYYPARKDLNAVSPYAHLFLNAVLGKTTIMARQEAEYSPYYSLRFLPAAPATPEAGAISRGAGGDTAIEERRAYGFNTAAGLTYALTTRSSLVATYGWQRRDFEQQAQTDLSSMRGGIAYRRQMTRYAALRLGYGLEQADYRGPLTHTPRVRMHQLDIGADYRRPLSFSRRTMLDVKMGSTAVEGGLMAERVFRLIGDVGLTHEIGRTWELRGSYHRAAGVVEGLAQPVFSNGLSARLAGLLNRRTELTLDAVYTQGEIGLTGFRNPFDSASGTGRLQTALTSTLALFTDYQYYRYRFDDTYALPPGLPRNLDRQAVRAGLRLLLPIVRNVKKEVTPRVAR